jgi:hypothetical protein
MHPAASNYAIKSAHRRIEAAWQQLREAGFNIENHERSNDWSLVAQGRPMVQSSDLVESFQSLPQIISREAPLTVRRPMYVGIGTLFKDSSEYDSCQRLILQMRRAGLVPFESITDPTRERVMPAMWKDLADYAEWVADVYQRDLWQDQDAVVEFFIEKQAMEGVIAPVTRNLRVSLIPIRGQCSETWCWSVAQDWNGLDKPVFVFYIGDHDSFGLSIERSLRERIQGYLDEDRKDCFHWERLAVTAADLRNRDLPGFPVKRDKNDSIPTASRAYFEEFGDRCVEADALSPIEIRRRCEEAIQRHIDPAKWKAMLEIEAMEKAEVRSLITQ